MCILVFGVRLFNILLLCFTLWKHSWQTNSSFIHYTSFISTHDYRTIHITCMFLDCQRKPGAPMVNPHRREEHTIQKRPGLSQLVSEPRTLLRYPFGHRVAWWCMRVKCRTGQDEDLPVSLSRTLLIIWMAFLFKASGWTRPSPTGFKKELLEM